MNASGLAIEIQRLPSDDVSRANTANSDTSWLRYPYQAQTESISDDNSRFDKLSRSERSSRSTPRSGGGFRRPRTPAPGIISSPNGQWSAIRAPFDCAINQNAAGTAQTGEGNDERCKST